MYLCSTLLLSAFFVLITQTVSDPMPHPPTPAAHRYTFLSLGDSYTIGESVETKDRWSVQLAAMLRKKGIDMAPPDIIARTGWTTAELAEAIGKSGNSKKYDLVSLLTGVNNQYRGQPLDRYQTEFRELLQTAIRYAGNQPNRVIVVSIPDWGVTPFAQGRDRARIAAEIDAFNAVCLQESRKAGVKFFNITPLSRQAAVDAVHVASDGLHFSGRQYGLWAEQMLPEVMKIFRK